MSTSTCRSCLLDVPIYLPSKEATGNSFCFYVFGMTRTSHILVWSEQSTSVAEEAHALTEPMLPMTQVEATDGTIDNDNVNT